MHVWLQIQGSQVRFRPCPIHRRDWSKNNFYGHSPPFCWIIQERLLSVTNESMCTKYWLTAFSSLPSKKSGKVNWLSHHDHSCCLGRQGFFQQLWEKAPGQNWGKMINLTAKLGEISDIEHNKGSKIYPQNQVILDCIMSTIPLKHKCLSIILIWVIVSHKM